VIDTGTNSTRLLVAEMDDGGVVELERRTTITRLGEGVDSGGSLHQDARERVRACVEGYARLVREYGAAPAMLLATSSVRDASDGEQFLKGLAAEFGFGWRLLSGDEEARLSFRGAAMGFDPDDRVLLFDVGGGSTEVVLGGAGSVSFARSLNLGCVRLTERFFRSDPVGREELDRAGDYINEMMSREIGRQRHAGSGAKSVAVAGTASTLAAIDLGLSEYDRKRVHGHVITTDGLTRLLARLAAMSTAERLKIGVMEEGRADVIVAGALILDRLLSFTGSGSFSVSELDILDGAAAELAAGRL